jgi:hypothetical protein
MADQIKYYGIYFAKCIGNKDPLALGRILVHIYMRDGEFNYDENSHQWIPVLSPYGGNPQMGMFMLPPIHANGYVVFEEGDPRRPVWIGSYALSAKTKIDEEASKSAGFTVFKTEASIPPETGNDPTTFIIKTQYTTLDNKDVTSNDNKIENMIVMNESKLELVHVNQSKYSYKYGGISEEFSRSYLRLEDDSITIGVKNSDGEVHEIQVKPDGIYFKSQYGDTISIRNGYIDIIGLEKTKINIKSIGPIEVNGKNVLVEGEQLIVGAPGDKGGGGAVTCDTICPFVGLAIHVGSTKTIVGG